MYICSDKCFTNHLKADVTPAYVTTYQATFIRLVLFSIKQVKSTLVIIYLENQIYNTFAQIFEGQCRQFIENTTPLYPTCAYCW